jgi:hypothetical protein
MNQTRTLPLQVHVTERESDTTAEVTVTMQSGAQFRGHGAAYRNPKDTDVPEIGDELATARALSELAHRLVEAATSAEQPPEPVYVVTQTEGYDGDYGYDLAHDVPGR